MKEYLAELVRRAPTPVQARNSAREYLQVRILGALQRVGAMIPLAFHGGTALRFLYATARYSEDLDFALEKDRECYDFRAYLQAIQAELSTEGCAVEFRVNDRKVIHSALVRFPGLLYELGSSPQKKNSCLRVPAVTHRLAKNRSLVICFHWFHHLRVFCGIEQESPTIFYQKE